MVCTYAGAVVRCTYKHFFHSSDFIKSYNCWFTAESSLDFRLPDETCFFEGDKRHHRVGTVFHPYVMPFGYQKCAVCSCSVSGRLCNLLIGTP